MEHVSRAKLEELSEQPMGNKALQDEADSHLLRRGAVKPSVELKATCKRIAKTWLPDGRKAQRRVDTQEAEKEFYARQLDIEDAVEKAGGQRGGMGRQ